MLEVGKMDKRKDLSMFDKSQIVAWGHVRAQAAAVVEYSRSAVPTVFKKWLKEGTMVNQ